MYRCLALVFAFSLAISCAADGFDFTPEQPTDFDFHPMVTLEAMHPNMQPDFAPTIIEQTTTSPVATSACRVLADGTMVCSQPVITHSANSAACSGEATQTVYRARRGIFGRRVRGYRTGPVRRWLFGGRSSSGCFGSASGCGG